MHYGEYAFRNKEWGGIASQATRTLYPNPLSISSVMVQSLQSLTIIISLLRCKRRTLAKVLQLVRG